MLYTSLQFSILTVRRCYLPPWILWLLQPISFANNSVNDQLLQWEGHGKYFILILQYHNQNTFPLKLRILAMLPSIPENSESFTVNIAFYFWKFRISCDLIGFENGGVWYTSSSTTRSHSRVDKFEVQGCRIMVNYQNRITHFIFCKITYWLMVVSQ